MTAIRIPLTLATVALFAALAFAFAPPASSGAFRFAEATSPDARAAMPLLYKNCTPSTRGIRTVSGGGSHETRRRAHR
jgi:hypothetical protein